MNKKSAWLLIYLPLLCLLGAAESKAGIPYRNAPVISFSSITLYENRPAGTLAGILGISPGNMLNTYTFSLVPGKGDCSNHLFTVTGGHQVTTIGPLDYEERKVHCIRVRATAQDGSTTERSFSVYLNDVNEQPTLEPIADQQLCYMQEPHVLNLQGAGPGPEKRQKITFSVSADQPEFFEELQITAAGKLTFRVRQGISGRTTVTVAVQDDGGTENGGEDTFSRQFNVTVSPPPSITITSSSGTSVSKGNTVDLVAAGGVSYQWIDPEGAISGTRSATLTIRPSQTSVYRVRATSQTGCKIIQEIRIEVVEDYLALVPTNVITPNGDGKNDRLVVKNIDMYPGNEIRIFDKAGRMLFSKKNYRDEWDGTYQGSTLEEGAYFYVLDFGENRRQLKGHVTIIRD
ncbi:MAG TPA: gliding motility-associated C-terminal domain-containing protein [Sphingobacteriaceae bacterium]